MAVAANEYPDSASGQVADKTVLSLSKWFRDNTEKSQYAMTEMKSEDFPGEM